MATTKYDATLEYNEETGDLYFHVFQTGVTDFTVGSTETGLCPVNLDFNEANQLIGVEVLN